MRDRWLGQDGVPPAGAVPSRAQGGCGLLRRVLSPPSHWCLLEQVSDLDDWGWRMLCSRGVWRDSAQQAEPSISLCNTVQIHASVSPTSRRLSSRFEQPKSNSFPWKLLPDREESRAGELGCGACRGSAGAAMGAGCRQLQGTKRFPNKPGKSGQLLVHIPMGALLRDPVGRMASGVGDHRG